VRPAGDRGVPGRVGTDGRPDSAAVGQGRLRVRRPGQVRPVGARDALGAAVLLRLRRAVARSPVRPARDPAGRPARLRHAVRRRHRRGVPGGVAGADGHPPPTQAAGVLRPGHRDRADPSRPDPGQLGTSLHPAQERPGRGDLSAPEADPGAEEDLRHPAVPGTADAAGHRRRRLHPRRGRPGPPGDGFQAQPGEDGRTAQPALRRHARARHHRRDRRRHLRQDQGIRRLRLRREPRDQLRVPGLRLVLAQALPPRRVLRRAAQRPADGFLLATVAGPGRPPARGPGAGTGHQRLAGGRLADRTRTGQTRSGQTRTGHPMSARGRRNRRCGWG
jgi:hypothetical protein